MDTLGVDPAGADRPDRRSGGSGLGARPAAALIALASGAFVWHAWTDAPATEGRPIVLALLATPGVLSLLALGVPARVRRGLLVAVATWIVALVGSEAALRAHGPRRPLKLPPSYDRRTPSEVLLDLYQAGERHVPTYHPSGFLHAPPIGGQPTIPFGSISLAPTLFCNSNQTGEYVRYTSDEHGFRNPPGTWAHPHYDIALVGDSFTMGACEPEGGTLGDWLRTVHPATVNLGSSGSGPLIELAALREYLPDLRPRLVVWFFYEGNDLRDLERERRVPLLMQYLEPGFSQGLRARQAEIDRFFNDLTDIHVAKQAAGEGAPARWSQGRQADRQASFSAALRLDCLQRHISHALRRPPPPWAGLEPDFEFLGRVLGEARATVESWGGELLFVYLPSYPTLSRRISHPYRERVLAVAAAQDLATIDVARHLLESPDPIRWFPLRRDNHFNSEGYREIADLVLATARGTLAAR